LVPADRARDKYIVFQPKVDTTKEDEFCVPSELPAPA